MEERGSESVTPFLNMIGILEFNKMIQRVDIDAVVNHVINFNKPLMEELNRTQLFNQGIDSEGDKLMDYASEAYANEKHSRNPSPGYGTPDLYNTGEFHEQITAEINDEEWFMTGYDQKSMKLASKYGDSIFGLTEQSIEDVRNENNRGIIKAVKRIMKL